MSEEYKKNGQKGALIYVVDDEPMLLELATVILQPSGYEIKTFRDPELALQSFTNENPKPRLLITDYAMHNMNGMQLLEKFRRIQPDQKILLVSGTVGEDIYGNSALKPDHFLAKPYHSKELIEVVEALVKG